MGNGASLCVSTRAHPRLYPARAEVRPTMEFQMLITDLFSLEGKVAGAIGAGGVLAGEMARGFAGAGADVVIVDLNLDAANARAEEVRQIGRKALACRTDVSKK